MLSFETPLETYQQRLLGNEARNPAKQRLGRALHRNLWAPDAQGRGRGIPWPPSRQSSGTSPFLLWASRGPGAARRTGRRGARERQADDDALSGPFCRAVMKRSWKLRGPS